MRCLLVFCHPSPESFGAALFKLAEAALREAGHEVRCIDLYQSGFQPVMDLTEWQNYELKKVNEQPVSEHVALLKWAEMLVLLRFRQVLLQVLKLFFYQKQERI